MTDIHKVRWDRRIERRLARFPVWIQKNFQAWVSSVQLLGLRKTRGCKGFHDEALSGQWNGYRSVRLSKAYRVIYIERWCREQSFIEVAEVSKHEY